MVRLLILVLLLITPALQGAELPPYSRGYSSERDPFADGRAAIALATETSRRVLIEVGGDWCAWCHVLDRIVYEHPEVKSVLRENYVVLKVNVSDENDNAAFLAGLPKLDGFPKLFIARADGALLHAQDPSAFIERGTYSPSRVRAFLERWAAGDVSQP